MKAPVSFREHLQELIERIDKAYIKSGSLRDLCTLEEKQLFNSIRKKLYEANMLAIDHDNTIPDDRAHTIVSWKEADK